MDRKGNRRTKMFRRSMVRTTGDREPRTPPAHMKVDARDAEVESIEHREQTEVSRQSPPRNSNRPDTIGAPQSGSQEGEARSILIEIKLAQVRVALMRAKGTENRVLTSRECIPDSTPTLDNNIPAPIRRFRCSPTWHPLCCITPSPIHRKSQIPMEDAIKSMRVARTWENKKGGASESEAVWQAEAQGKAHVWSHS